MDPLEVLAALIRSSNYEDIGGAPQAIKVYRHLNSEAFSTLWQVGAEVTPTYSGRPLLDYERTFAPALDPNDPGAHARRARQP